MKKTLLIIILLINSNQIIANDISTHVVKLSVITQSYDYDSPWKKNSIKKINITGTVLKNDMILTKSYSLANNVFIEASKFGESTKYEATIIINDYHNGLALLKVKNKSFFQGLKRVPLANSLRIVGKRLKIYRWDSTGSFKEYAAEVNKSSIRIYNPNCAVLMHQLSSGMNDGGNGEPILYNGKLAGITTGYDEKNKIIYAISINTIERMLNNFSEQKYRGVPFFWIKWDAIDSDVNLREYFGMKKNDSGIIVTRVPKITSGNKLLKQGDVILSIDGTNIDDSGKYASSEHGKLNYLGIIYLNHSVGDFLTMNLLRNKKKIKIKFKLLPIPAVVSTIPELSYDKAPPYYIYGGLIFQELTNGYLRTWGKEWAKSANKRLLYYYNNAAEPRDKKHTRSIVLNRILPASINSGYQSKKNLILKSINGSKIGSIKRLRKILESNNESYTKFEFIGGDTIVLSSEEVKKMNKIILEKYNIHEQYYIKK